MSDFFDDERLGPYTAPGGPALHPDGVQWLAPWEDPYAGFPEHCRRQVEALALVENVQLRSVFPRILPDYMEGDDDELVYRRVKPLLDRTIGKAWAQVYSVVPSEGLFANLLNHRLMSKADMAVINRARVIYLVLERDRVSSMMAASLNRFGQVWTTCQKSVQALTDSGVDPKLIRQVPMPYRLDEPRLDRVRPARKNDVPRFLHIGKWEPRKAQDRLVLAFMQAFRPREAKLVVKTGSGFFRKTDEGYPQSPFKALERALEDQAVKDNGWTREVLESPDAGGLRVFTDRRSDGDIDRLHQWADCYVSLSHAEGWDMPAFDACLQGTLLLSTRSGGPEAFAPADTLWVPTSGLIPTDPCYGWGESSYWDFSQEAAVQALLLAAGRVMDEGPAQQSAARAARQSAMRRFSPRTVGLLMRDYLQELRGGAP